MNSSSVLRRLVRLAALPLTALLTLTTTAALAYEPGIDTSNWQHNPSINWSKVAASGVKFAFLKATEGSSYHDPYYKSDAAAAAGNGIYHGAYHFARPSIGSAAAQARYFVAYAGKQNQRGNLPPVLDLEATGGLSNAHLITWTRNWLTTVQSLTGRDPIIYCSPAFWNEHMNNSTAFTNYPLWIANYGVKQPWVPGGWSTYSFWQTTSSGRISGISGNTDKDLFNGSMTQLRKFALDYTRSATSLTVAADDDAPLTGQTVSLTGTLASSSGAVLGGKTVVLSTRPSGSSSWTSLASDTTGSGGGYSFAVPVNGPGSYRVHYGGNANYKPSTSPVQPVTITPTPTQTVLSTSNAAPYASQSVTLSGTVLDSSKQPVPGRPVVLSRKLAGSSRWTTVAKGSTDDNGAFAMSAKVNQPASYRTTYPGDARYARSRSTNLAVAITPPQALSLTEVSALATTALVPGAATTVSGNLTTVNGDAMPSRYIRLFKRDADRGWHQITKRHTVAADGSWKVTIRPHQSADYQVRFNGGDRYAAASAAPVTVTVAPPLRTRIWAAVHLPKRGYVAPGRTLNLHGRLRVVGVGGLAPRWVHLLRRTAGSSTWKVSRRTATVAPDGSWQFSVAPRRSNYYKVSFAGGWHFAGSTSPRVRVPVR